MGVHSKKSLKQDLDHHYQSITNVTLDNENVVFKVIKMACFSADREAACHCIDSSASLCIIPHTLMLPLSSNHTGTEGQQERESYLRRREGFYNLSKKRQRNHCLIIHISWNTTKGGELFNLGIGFGSRTVSHKTITDKFQLAVKRWLLSTEKQGDCNRLPTKAAAPLATVTHARTKTSPKISPTGFETNPGAFLKGLGEGIVCN